MSTTEFINPAVETAFNDFLQKYYEIEAMLGAWNKFETEWEDRFKEQIEVATEKLETGAVTNLLEAQTLIGPVANTLPAADASRTYWLWEYTNMKRVGLITGINPRGLQGDRYRGENLLPATALDNIKQAFSGRNAAAWNQDEVDDRTLKQKARAAPEL